jgi:hypothetical protein
MTILTHQRQATLAARRTSIRRHVLAVGGLVILAVAFLLLLAFASAPQAQAASWHTKLSGSGHAERRTFGQATMHGGRDTRLKYWTAKKWDADDGGEWEYDWVKFKLVRSDTGATVKTFGPYYSPTGYQDWHTASVSLPSGGVPYKLKVTSDDARWGFKLQQKY